MRYFSAVVLFVAMMLAQTGIALAGERVALVVGVSTYRAIPSLQNPARDAASVAAALRQTGFDVTELNQPAQLTRAALGAALVRFRARADSAEAAVIYFAGHGVEVNGANWLLPADVTADSPDDLEVTAIAAASVVNAVRGASTIRLVILDACRDNPFATNPGWGQSSRSFGTRGLGREASRADNVVLLLATQPGNKASDGMGQTNSPFARALAATLTTDGMQIAALPAMVSRRMRETEGVDQRPDQQGIFDEPAWMFKPGRVWQAALALPDPADVAPARPTSEPLAGISSPLVLQPGRRVALVVGNGSYTAGSSLPNSVNDARLVGSALGRAGFETISASDVSRAQLSQALRDFRQKADGSELAVIYFAGHGIRIDGIDWLLPVDVKLSERSDVSFEAINVNVLIETTAGAKARMVALDTSRSNPFDNPKGPATSASRMGMANPVNAIVIFATSPGGQATDGTTGNSPFSSSLAARLVERGLSMQQLADKVRDDVMTATNGIQQPSVNSGLTGAPILLFPGASQAP